MKHLVRICIFSFLVTTQLSSQNAPNFTITDSDGVEHSLYEDYLDKGITVVLKFFFVNCPPCNSIAPSMQTLYEDSSFKNRHNLTFPSAGGEGNAPSAIAPYTSGTFGNFFGTPSFAVIAPDKSVVYNTGGAGNSGKIANLDAAIKDTGAQGIPGPEPSTFNISIKDGFGNIDDQTKVYLEDANNPSNSYLVSGNQLIISDLESEYPGIINPVLRFENSGNAEEKVSPLDLLIMRKHLLAIINITDPAMVLAGDTNGDGNITPLDMLIMRKFILNIITDFPDGNYKFLPEELPISIIPGQSQDLEVISVKMGDLNGI